MNVLASKEKSDSAPLDECLALYRKQKGSQTEQEATAEKLRLLVYPYLLESARYHMKSGRRGRDLPEPMDLTNEVWQKIFSQEEILANYRIGEVLITTYLWQIVENELKDDGRSATGRGNFMPRVYLHDPEIMESMKSKKRSQSGYVQLRQIKDLLYRYLENLPGKVAVIPTNVRKGNTGMKRVPLTHNHVKLLKAWMDPSNEDVTWKEMSDSIGKPAGTIKRWFSEVTEHLKNDPDDAAQRLRDAYKISLETAFLSPDTEYAN